MKTKILILLSLLVGGILIFNACDQETIDPQKTVFIGDQEWMVYNLYADTFRNGEPIPEAQTVGEWIQAAEEGRPAWCNNFNPLDESTFGKLYNWYALTDPRGIAPEGWHVPSDAEWNRLSNYLGGSSVAGKKMKSTHLWNDGGGSNSSGFAAEPGTSRDEQGLTYGWDASSSVFWSSTETGNGIVLRSLQSYSTELTRVFSTQYTNQTTIGKGAGISVRCLKGEKDIETIPTIVIGNQEWTVSNLNVDTFRNGELIPQAITIDEWVNASTEKKPAWCYYNNDPANGAIYGKLYNWYAVTDLRGLAPKKYHIPTDAEWTLMSDALGGVDIAGLYMKSINGWSSPSGGGNNYSGFTGLPGQFRYQNGPFYSSTPVGLFWSATGNDELSAILRGLSDGSDILSHYPSHKGCGLSVRCVLD